jgi:hypothetical protein
MSTLTIDEIMDRAATVGVETKKWIKGDKMRIYAQTGRKDMSVYLELEGDDEEHIEGAAFKVYCTTDQHPNWIKTQIKKYREKYIGLFYAYVCEDFRDTPEGECPKGYGDDSKKCLEDARAFFKENAEED